MNLSKVQDKQGVKILAQLAQSIWEEYYPSIIGQKQTHYMVEKYQSVEGLIEQLKSGYQYYFVESEEQKIGYLAFLVRAKGLYVSKFYLSKQFRRQGYAQRMLAFLIDQAKKASVSSITLNVNKDNEAAINTYEKLGFKKIGEEVIDIGQGYVMDDYVYEYRL